MFQTLFQLGVSGIKTLISNARVGKQVLATGATITTQTSGSGSNVNVSSAGSMQIPSWLMPVGIVLGGLLAVGVLFKLLFGKK